MNMLTLNVFIVNILILINTELSVFFITFEKAQKLIHENLIKIKQDGLIPIRTISRVNSNVNLIIDEIESLIDENDMVFSKQQSLFMKIYSIIEYFKVFESFHKKTILKIDKTLFENHVLLTELKSLINQHRRNVNLDLKRKDSLILFNIY